MAKKLFFPIIRNKPSYVVGVQIENGSFASSLSYIRGNSWIKRRINWEDVDTRGNFSKEDTDLNLVQYHPLLLTIHNAPARHLINPIKPCGALKESSYDAYANFVISVIDRYTKTQPVWIELWNEPDATGSIYPDLFGCWPSDGILYGQMVNYVYNKVKTARPNTKIYAGALSGMGDFINHVPKCDGISYHIYTPVESGIDNFISTRNRAERLRALGHKDILLSETSLLDSTTPEDEDIQAAYFEYLLDLSDVLTGFFWYTLYNNNWRHSDMATSSGKKRVWYRYEEEMQNGI